MLLSASRLSDAPEDSRITFGDAFSIGYTNLQCLWSLGVPVILQETQKKGSVCQRVRQSSRHLRISLPLRGGDPQHMAGKLKNPNRKLGYETRKFRQPGR